MSKGFYKRVAANIGIAEGIGIIGSFITRDAVSSWYQQLEKPSFNPPSWIFGPVWTVLYALMGIAASRVQEQTKRSVFSVPMAVYGTQLLLNLLWTLIFFGMKMPQVAFVEIIILWIAICGTIIVFWRIDKWAAILLVPYLLWVSFASVLNYAIVSLNKT